MTVDFRKDKNINFIIGIGRSGTTILTKLLNAFKEVHCLPEAIFLIFFSHHYKHKKIFTEMDVLLVFEQIELYSHSHPWVGWEFNLLEVKSECLNIVKSNSHITYQELCLRIYENFKVVGIDKTNASILIDKNPSHTIFLNELTALYPDSKFIWIVRDYRANVLSRKQSIDLRSPNVVYNAVRWLLYNREAYEFYMKNKHKVLLIRYEDLVSNYEAVELKLIEFLNITPEKELHFNEEKQKINLDEFKMAEKFKERFVKKYSDLNKTLNTDRLNVWKEQLSNLEIEQCDTICSSVGLKLGYEPVYYEKSYMHTLITLFKHFKPVIKGYIDINKDNLFYYISPSIKIKRLHKRYLKLGFINK